MRNSAPPAYVSTTNACHLCMPLGACLAFKGIEGAVPYLHGSQGCATYMRRYLISHYREPVDIASSALGERQAVFGGAPNLRQGLWNVITAMRPKVIGVATTCLTETIGEEPGPLAQAFLAELAEKNPGAELPHVVTVRTPSYGGTHTEGFRRAVQAVLETLARPGPAGDHLNLLPGMASPADLRYLKRLVRAFSLEAAVIPDPSDPLDGPSWSAYTAVPPGGTPLEALRAAGRARATVAFGCDAGDAAGPGAWLQDRFGVPLIPLGPPVGLRAADRFLETLEDLSGRPVPDEIRARRGRLVDAYVDAHKYLARVRAAVVADEDLAAAMAGFLAETGIRVVYVATGDRPGSLGAAVEKATAGLLREPPFVQEGADYHTVDEATRDLGLELVVGTSKAYPLARARGIPLVRVGFPIHDRFGAARQRLLGYAGTQALFDRVVNALLAHRQEASDVGYGYL
ncbi:MAG: nitrogenase [Candidatus Dadabacteria bacterium]|nr:MAG: nitrogenase [Candidatus Dadabacteria bacterium]